MAWSRKLWRDSDSSLRHPDRVPYDHFTPFVFAQLEELASAVAGRPRTRDRREAFTRRSAADHTNGGLLGEAYITG